MRASQPKTRRHQKGLSKVAPGAQRAFSLLLIPEALCLLWTLERQYKDVKLSSFEFAYLPSLKNRCQNVIEFHH